MFLSKCGNFPYKQNLMVSIELYENHTFYLFGVEYFISFLNIPFMAKTDRTAFHNIFLSAINMHINGL